MTEIDPLVARHSTLNPYRWAASELINRVLWDLRLQSWLSRKKLKNIKNKHKGKKAVILCNGPSLNKVDFESLKDKCFTFGLNKVNLLFDKTDFRPGCIVAVNSLVIEQNREFYNSTDIELYLDSMACKGKVVYPRKNIVYMHSTGIRGFAKDVSISIYQGYTVTYVAMQLAFHMGFSKVALVGADHNFSVKGPANLTVTAGDIDESHFDPNYFSGVKWQLPDLFESEVSYEMANKIYQAHNRKIYNCTDGGKLELFERMTLEEFLMLD